MQFNGAGKQIDFSVVVPVYNSERTLRFCLEALANQTIPKEKFEVIVVDDGSTDSTSEIARNFDVRYIFQKNRGPAMHGILGPMLQQAILFSSRIPTAFRTLIGLKRWCGHFQIRKSLP